MKPTEKIYDNKPFCNSFSATVLSCVSCEDGYRVVLDRTAFFPGGGGQDPDRGTVGGHPLKRIFEDKGVVYHIIGAPVVVGTRVNGTLDWDFRFTNMQNHSGEHILSGIAHSQYGYDNVGFHMNDRFITIDFNGPLTDEQINELELAANRRIYENLPITISHPYKEELEQMNYRSKKELTGDVRIVQVGTVDTCACCAPHVEFTGQVGLIKIIAHENYKGGVRLTVLCGERALRYYQTQNELLGALCGRYSATLDTLPQALSRLEGELTRQKERIAGLSDALIDCRVAELKTGAASIFHVETAMDETACRRLCNRLSVEVPGRVAIMFPVEEKTYRYFIASVNEDVRVITKAFNEAFSGRGGGSERMTQGSVTGNLADMKKLFIG